MSATRKKFIILCIVMLCLYINVYANGESYIVRFKDGYFPDAAKYNLEAVDAQRGLYTAKSTDWAEEESDYIDYICPNSEAFLIEGEEGVVPFSVSETEELYYKQWELINASEGWLMESYGNDVVVGIIDSGCYSHEDLEGNVIVGRNYLDKNADTSDNIGHGTHVSGIVAAKIDNGGIAGVAPKAKIVPLKCFDISRNPTSDVLVQAIYDAVDVYKCSIINMSWGLKSDNPALKEAIDYADSKGVILVAAVGNAGSSLVYYPAGYENVIGVGSVTTNKTKSTFSQYNNSVNVVAPGESVKSTYNDGSFAYMSGTSQASPMVSGIAAVALSVDKTLTSAKLRNLLQETSEDLGDSGYDVSFGYGLVNEAALIGKLLENVECYVSPINVSGTYAYVKIKNCSEKPLVAESIFSRYSQNKFVKASRAGISVESGKSVTVYTDNDAENMRHFLWNNITELKPVTAKRE